MTTPNEITNLADEVLISTATGNLELVAEKAVRLAKAVNAAAPVAQELATKACNQNLQPCATAFFTEKGEVAFTGLFDRTLKALEAVKTTRMGISAGSIDLYAAPVDAQSSGSSGELESVADKLFAEAYQAGMDGDEFDALRAKRLIARAALADQASDTQTPIDIERLRYWLSKYGHSTPESLEEMGDQANSWVNRLLRLEPFPQDSGQDREDAERLDWLRDTCCDLRSINMPTGGDDAEVRWVVIEHHMAKPHGREIGRSITDDPRGAIDAARAAAKEG